MYIHVHVICTQVYWYMYTPTEHFIPARVLGAIEVSGGLVDRVADSNPAVRVHPREAIVLYQLGL